MSRSGRDRVLASWPAALAGQQTGQLPTCTPSTSPPRPESGAPVYTRRQRMWQTARDSEVDDQADELPVPGVIVVWSGDAPALLPFRLPPSGLIIGRELL